MNWNSAFQRQYTPNRTREGGSQYEFTLCHHLEFFSKAGSLFENRQSFYGVEETALGLFQKTWIVDKELSFRLLLFLRDCRGGAGNRSGARSIYNWLANNDPEWLSANIDWLIEVGRWDDLRSFFNTPIEDVAVHLWVNAIMEGNVLAAKWADRKDKPLRDNSYGLQCNEGELRKLLSKIRKDHIVEHKMCSKEWLGIEYEKVPSVAMSRYTNAFKKNDGERFNEYKEALKKGETTVHAGVLFPHDCVRTAKHGDNTIADAQFDALPNYMEGCNERILVLSDTSSSMEQSVSGVVQAMDVSQGIALYCSSRFEKGSPFYKKFVGFCSEGSFKDWDGMTFSQAVRSRKVFNGAVGSTRIDKALQLILSTAKMFSITDEQMPTVLLIVSDMQFHSGVRGNGTEVDKALALWKEAGYSIPKVVYWNTAGYQGSPETVRSNNIGLVSGFSPSILKAVFGGDDFSPRGIMMRAIQKYDNITNPEDK